MSGWGSQGDEAAVKGGCLSLEWETLNANFIVSEEGSRVPFGTIGLGDLGPPCGDTGSRGQTLGGQVRAIGLKVVLKSMSWQSGADGPL